MQLTFSVDDPKRTTLLGPDHRPVFAVESESKFMHAPNTAILRFEPGVQKPTLVGEVQYMSFEKDSVKVYGLELERDTSFWGHVLTFRASNGQSFKWKFKSGGLELVTADTEQEVALYRRSHRNGLFGPRQPATLVLSERFAEGPQIVDDIVTTWSYVEERSRRRKRNAAASASANAAATGVSC